MGLSMRYGLTGIAALGLLTAVHQLRGMDRPKQATSDYLIGVLPNFAAAIAITFILLSIWADRNPEAANSIATRWFVICGSISGVGLFAWEIFQKTSDRLVFDPHDLGATVVGLAAAGILFYWVSPRQSTEV